MGVLTIVFALRRGGPALYAERRPFLTKVKPGTVGAMPLGMAFAAGWTPCLGPVLTGILAIATTQSSLRGVLLLLAYSLGLGVPFLLVGLGVQRFVGAFGWVKRHHAWIAGASGALLIAVGMMLMTGTFTRLFAPLSRFAPGL
jgi:cytochrome c-type biogenesis protein